MTTQIDDIEPLDDVGPITFFWELGRRLTTLHEISSDVQTGKEAAAKVCALLGITAIDGVAAMSFWRAYPSMMRLRRRMTSTFWYRYSLTWSSLRLLFNCSFSSDKLREQWLEVHLTEGWTIAELHAELGKRLKPGRFIDALPEVIEKRLAEASDLHTQIHDLGQ